MRRLTGGEYTYTIRDLTGLDLKFDRDFASDSVGGEGFTNFGDVQFVEDTSIERYLEAAKLVADHAVVGAGPLEFYTDTGKTGLELSALSRINDLYATKGFRVVSGECGRPFCLERYGKDLIVDWYFKHRVALGDPHATLRGLAAKENITGRFADHIWTAVNKANTGYPTRMTVDGWMRLPVPTSDVEASIANARKGCDDLYKALTTWPSWFFARGDLAAGGAGDESPLTFDDTSLKVEPTHHYTYGLGVRAGRGRGAPVTPGPVKVYLTFTDVNPRPGVTPVIVWRNPRIVTRAAAAPGRGAPGAAIDATTVVATGRGRGATGPIQENTDIGVRSVDMAEITIQITVELALDAEVDAEAGDGGQGRRDHTGIADANEVAVWNGAVEVGETDGFSESLRPAGEGGRTAKEDRDGQNSEIHKLWRGCTVFKGRQT